MSSLLFSTISHSFLTRPRSPNVKHRMTREDFMKNNRGIDDGKDIDPVFLS
jgi:brefeldin A-inhibited guanine nucleotide-exchange protein